MRPWLAWACLALGPALGAAVPAAGGALPVRDPRPAPDWTAWKQTGLELGFRFSGLSVFNAGPLAYSPFELGWRFANGLRVRSGVLVFYYEGLDSDPKQPELGVERYSYEMIDWRSSLEYVVPLPFRLRPCVGLGLDLIGGNRKRAVRDSPVEQPKTAAWGMAAPGALLGLDWRGGERWALGLQSRFSHGFTQQGPVVATELSWHHLF